MEITTVSSVLAQSHFSEPVLKALIPDEQPYKILLFQPKGDIEIGDAYIRHLNRDLAHYQFHDFIQKAEETKADVAVSPEYSMPWNTLLAAVKAGNLPEYGKLWAFGCESLKYSDLETLKTDLSGTAQLIYEQLEPEEDRFVCPLAYVFKAPLLSCPSQFNTVILVQFKTYPMGGVDFEINGMQKGTKVYQFGNGLKTLRLITLICSDALVFDNSHAEEIYSRTLILHIQLNKEPRHNKFRHYRSKIFDLSGNETEIICLNWAQGVHSWRAGVKTSWDNVSCSAWYLRPDKFDVCDATLSANHQRGLYYTWLHDLRLHALFFNFNPAMFLLKATKVAHIAVPAPMSRRTGPKIIDTFEWGETDCKWTSAISPNDEFTKISTLAGNAKVNVESLAAENPFYAERVLALCAGKVEEGKEWFTPNKLDSCKIELSETISRLTFCQDTDKPASEFRIRRLKRCAHLWDILTTPGLLPPALAGFESNFSLTWSDKSPHQNLLSDNGVLATVVYMGEDTSEDQIKNTAKRVAEYLRDTFKKSKDYRQAMQHFSLWYRSGGEIMRYDCERFFSISETGDESEVDIGRSK
jgi:hypothetical protein